jgi:multicomponent Na+:H+ antiporter subunit E
LPIIGLLIVLSSLWILLSGHFEAFYLSLGAVSVALSCWLWWRAGLANHDRLSWRHVPRLLIYQVWLLKEIACANWAVIREILRPRLAISPTVLRVPASQPDDLGRVIFANSITLTPGTIALEVDAQGVLVHALSATGAAALADGSLDARVSAIYGVRRC